MDAIESINLIRRLQSLPEINSAIEKSIVRFMHSYLNEMYEIEKDDIEYYKNKNRDPKYSDVSISRKIEVHKKYWSNHGVFYMPCSIGSEPDHDWEKISDISIQKNDDDDNNLFLFISRYQRSSSRKINFTYLLKRNNGNFSIEHRFM